MLIMLILLLLFTMIINSFKKIRTKFHGFKSWVNDNLFACFVIS